MPRILLLALCGVLLMTACGKKAEEKKAAPPPTLVTVTQVKRSAVEVTEETLGTLEAIDKPRIAAEVAGRIVQLRAVAGKAVKRGDILAVIDATDLALASQSEQAEVKRLEALLAQQERLVERQGQLVAKGFISQNALDEAMAQRAAIAAQLAAARAREGLGQRSVGKATVHAPLDGVIENQLVAPGDYVKVGDPLFELVSNRRLRAHLPFPEGAAARLSRGQAVRLSSPLAPGKTFEARVTDIRPALSPSSRALGIVVELDNSGGELKAGGTVNATVLIAAKEAALVVPEQSVVLRPAGKVVYALIEEDGKKKAQQRQVQTGAKRGGQIEILAGLEEGETVVQDGAGFLSHGAVVAIKEPAKSGQKVGAGDTARPAVAGK